MTEPLRGLTSAEALTEATGRDWDAWFAIVDDWDGARDDHAALTRHLTDTHGVEARWARAITTGYQRARGRDADGMFVATASTTIGVSADVVFDLWSDTHRAEWLPEELIVRGSRRPVTLLCDWAADGTPVRVDLVPRNPHEVVVRVAHERLADHDTMATRARLWRERLDALRRLAAEYKPM